MTQTAKKGPNETGESVTTEPQKSPLPPEIEPQLQLKWGLALLGKEKAAEYLTWLRARLGADAR